MISSDTSMPLALSTRLLFKGSDLTCVAGETFVRLFLLLPSDIHLKFDVLTNYPQVGQFNKVLSTEALPNGEPLHSYIPFCPKGNCDPITSCQTFQIFSVTTLHPFSISLFDKT